jgi:hypothetical protein
MPASPAAEMSALATTLDELTARVTALAQRLDHEPTEAVAIDLFEVERSLRSATRRLERARRNAPAT